MQKDTDFDGVTKVAERVGQYTDKEVATLTKATLAAVKEVSDKVDNIQLTPGPPGEQGSPGKDGAAATIEIESTITGEAGTSASVKNVGTANAAKLRITIPKGDKGDRGPQGLRGATGERGSQGLQGLPGKDGTNGSNGKDGTSAAWFTGTAMSGTGSKSVTISGAKAGDMYLNTSTYDVYKASSASSWTYQCNIKGATGPKGERGLQGAAGAAGAKGNDGAKGERGANATLVVAANNSTTKSKAAADYVCDGSSDQTEINSAITALPSTGGKIVLLEGTYNISGSINVSKDNVTIEGMGAGTVLKRMFNDGGFASNGLITSDKKNVTISNIKCDGNHSSYTSTANGAIKIGSNSRYYSIHDVDITNEYYGIVAYGGNNKGRIENNFIYDISGIGIYLYYTFFTLVCNNYISNAETGIQLSWYSRYNKILSNYIIRDKVGGGGEPQPDTYSSSQYTIKIEIGEYNDISDNFIYGKNYVNNGGSTNTFDNNRYQ